MTPQTSTNGANAILPAHSDALAAPSGILRDTCDAPFRQRIIELVEISSYGLSCTPRFVALLLKLGAAGCEVLRIFGTFQEGGIYFAQRDR